MTWWRLLCYKIQNSADSLNQSLREVPGYMEPFSTRILPYIISTPPPPSSKRKLSAQIFCRKSEQFWSSNFDFGNGYFDNDYSWKLGVTVNSNFDVFFEKTPNGLDPPYFWKFHSAFFCKYTLTCVNLQWHFWDWRWPPLPPFMEFFSKIYDKNLQCNFLDRKWPPPLDFFQKNIQI